MVMEECQCCSHAYGVRMDMESVHQYEKLVFSTYSPRVEIDNVNCDTATLVKVESLVQNQILIETLQMFIHLDLSIKKAFITSDEGWFMNVFYVTAQNGQTIVDENVISFMERHFNVAEQAAAASSVLGSRTTIEINGADRPGLLSNIFAMLTDLNIKVAETKLWTHNGRFAAIISVEEYYGTPIQDSNKLHRIVTSLRKLIKGGTATVSSSSDTSADRRLHQMMYAVRDFDLAETPSVSVQGWTERGYSVINVRCDDRPHLLYDVICTLTDMDYDIFHGTMDTTGDGACQDFWIRHSDKGPINTDAERQRVIQCLQAAIDRRSTKGSRLEFCVPAHHHDFLSTATRTFRESGLSVRRADIRTKGETTMNVFYFTDVAGCKVDSKMTDAIKERVCINSDKQLHGRQNESCPSSNLNENPASSNPLQKVGSFVMRILNNLGVPLQGNKLFKN